jgi:putative tryptophan/tyrosine transport system substrate-binding protein
MRRRDFLWALGAGLAATAPLLVRAQPAMPTVGIVTGAASRRTSTFPIPFLRSMKELGWEESRDFRALFLWTEGDRDRIPGLVDELVARRVNVIVAFGKPAVERALGARTTIPIVCMSEDMVKSGLAASMAQPDGNVTGVSLLANELDLKRLQLLHEAVPTAKRIGVLADATAYFSMRPQLDEAARVLNLELIYVDARNPEEVTQGLDILESAHVDAVNVLASPLLTIMRGLIIDRLNRARFPAIYQWPEMAEAEGLLAYGPRWELAYRHVAGLVDKILKGAKPGDLPIEQPDKIDLVVNLKTAKTLGLTIPPSLLTVADEVIE